MKTVTLLHRFMKTVTIYNPSLRHERLFVKCVFFPLIYFNRKIATDTEPTAPEPSDPTPTESPPEYRSGVSRSSAAWALAAPAASSAVRCVPPLCSSYSFDESALPGVLFIQMFKRAMEYLSSLPASYCTISILVLNLHPRNISKESLFTQRLYFFTIKMNTIVLI